MFRIKITRKAKKQLKSIKLAYQNQINLAIEDLHEDPYQGKPLTDELTKKYTYRVGVYRIIYTINEKDKIVTVLNAGHRATIYE